VAPWFKIDAAGSSRIAVYPRSLPYVVYVGGKWKCPEMEISFTSVDLAALCSSARRLAERWGEEAGGTVGRRLLDLLAADADVLHLLTGVRVSIGLGRETTLKFEDDIEIRGVIDRTTGDPTSGGRMVISAVAVARSVQR
jgi:hypothetical protein